MELSIFDERKIASAREILSKYFILGSGASIGGQGKVRGVAYRIPMDEVDVEITDAILVLLRYRICALSCTGARYILYQNGGEDVLSFVDLRGISQDCEEFNIIRVKLLKRFTLSKIYLTYRLNDYFDIPGLAEAFDEILEATSSDSKVRTLLLVMVYPENLSFGVLNSSFSD